LDHVEFFKDTIGSLNSLFRSRNHSDCLHDHSLMYC